MAIVYGTNQSETISFDEGVTVFDDTIYGFGGNDTIYGKSGNDTIFGGNGNDILRGGSGDDRLYGGAGFDFAAYSDLNTSFPFSGVTVRLMLGTSTSSLGNDTLNGIEGIVGTNRNDNIWGNNAINILIAGAGNDAVRGLGGADKLYGGDDIDTVAGMDGGDLIDGGTGGDSLSGGAGADVLIGGGGNDTLAGNAQGDILRGGTGNDMLTGGPGADIFVFNTALNAATNVDTVTDFSVAAETMRLDNSVFVGLLNGPLLPGQFYAGAAAHDLDDRIVYNPATGALFFDSNGNLAGGSTRFATLDTGLALTSADFFVI